MFIAARTTAGTCYTTVYSIYQL